MDAATDELSFRALAQEWRETWQVRALQASGRLSVIVCKPSGEHEQIPLSVIFMSVLAHNYDDAFPVMQQVAGITIKPPFLCTAAKISRRGIVFASVVTPTLDYDGQRVIEPWALFPNTGFMESYFRKLADELKLNDVERVEMFKAVQRWIVCDFRIDPTLDPRDPDAKRTRH